MLLQILVRTFWLVSTTFTPFFIRSFSTGHSGKHGHEFLEFEYSHGRLRYANNSNYRNDSLIRKESKFSMSLSKFVCLLTISVSVDRPLGRQGTQAHSGV